MNCKNNDDLFFYTRLFTNPVFIKSPCHEHDLMLISNLSDSSLRYSLKTMACNLESLISKKHLDDMKKIVEDNIPKNVEKREEKVPFLEEYLTNNFDEFCRSLVRKK